MDSLDTKVISAKDLIDYCKHRINKYKQFGSPIDEGKVEELYSVVGHIVDMPSENPEADEWCTDCPAYDHEKHYCPRFRKVIRRTVQEIQEERIPEHSAWFRISETLVDESKGDITAEQAVDKIRDYLKRMEKPEREKGEWLDMIDFEMCSVCGGTHLKEFQSHYGKTTWIKTNYCPNCGADMRGEKDG